MKVIEKAARSQRLLQKLLVIGRISEKEAFVGLEKEGPENGF